MILQVLGPQWLLLAMDFIFIFEQTEITGQSLVCLLIKVAEIVNTFESLLLLLIFITSCVLGIRLSPWLCLLPRGGCVLVRRRYVHSLFRQLSIRPVNNLNPFTGFV